MSKQFYSYISKQIIEHFIERQIDNGDKFSIRLDKEEQLLSLYDSLKLETIAEPFCIPKYSTFCLNISNIRVIVAATINQVKPDFLTYLRNMVGGIENDEFSNTAILFIHNSDLDSLLKGAESFHKEGMPLHSKTIVKDIKTRIENSKLSIADREIIKYVLERKTDEIFQDQSSIFEYEEIIEVLNESIIEKEQYKKFNLFYDSEIISVGTNKIKDRLKDNFRLFSKIDISHKYGNPEIDLEKDFEHKGLEKLCDKHWRNIEYKDIKSFETAKMTIQPLKYIESTKKQTDEGLCFWERAEGDSKAKSRIRNIIVFNNNFQKNILLEFSFDKHLTNQNVIVESKSEASAGASGKKLQISITHAVGNTGFSRITYKDDNTRYEFRIATVECNQGVLENIKTRYSINFKNKTIVVRIDDDKLIINPSGINDLNEKITAENNSYEVSDEEQKLELVKQINISEDDFEFINVNIKYMNTFIPIAIYDEYVKPILITGTSIWKLKRENQENFEYKGDNKIVQGTREYFAKEEFRKNIEKEKALIESGELFFYETFEGIIPEKIKVDIELEKSYKNLIKYYRTNNCLPSLTYMSSELFEIAKEYISQYIRVMGELENGKGLSPEQIDLIKLGTVQRTIDEKEIFLSPLHPLNIAYQLLLNEKVGNAIVSEEILKQLNPINLLPYIYKEKDKLYKAIYQSHSPEWGNYVSDNITRYKGSRDFISKLVREKIEEFIDHFSYLFSLSKNCPMKINIINLGDCKEVLQGIFEYYIKSLKKNLYTNDLLPLELYIYNDINTINAFEEISFYEDAGQIKYDFGVNLNLEEYDEEEILNIFRDKVHFYMMETGTKEYKYCHIAFYQLDQFQNSTYSNMNEISTGISMNGLLSGIPSVYTGSFYRTGFGTKFIDNDNELITVAKNINALARTAGGLYPYNCEEGINTAISNENKEYLNKIYDSAHWVTFINPKVDLNFFKNDAYAKDLIIIHYSDQYSSSSGYDAITVTRKSKQYQVILEEFLRNKNISDVERHSPALINMFNAVNGDWLLRLISNDRQFPREKLSILSAIKVCLAYLYHENIIWIPVSLEEILRVSGGTGLKSSEGLFSAKNLGKQGAFCDDILFIGIEEVESSINVYFYPAEVKIGNNVESVLQKAKEQITNTRKLLDQYLSKTTIVDGVEQREFSNWMYRNFIIHLAIISAEKMKLYDIWPQQNWDKIINSDVRTKLINDEFEISNTLDDIIGKGAIISFKKDIYFKEAKKEDDILYIEFLEENGYEYAVKDVNDLKASLINGNTDIVKEEMLYYVYNGDTNNEQAYASQNDEDTTLDEVAALKEVNDKFDTPEEGLNEPIKILFGNNTENGKDVYWYPTDTTKTHHTNTGIIGTMGTGKTQFTKSVITQLTKSHKSNVNGTKVGVLIFDYKGDYIKQEFTEVTNAKVYNLYHLPYNPLSLFLTDTTKNLLPLHTANSLKETISKAFNLGIKQETLLKDIIMETYEKRGIGKNDPTTWNKLAPTIYDVYQNYISREDLKEDSLYAAFTNLVDFEIFEPDSSKTKALFDIIDGVTVINLSGMDEGIQNLVVAITLDIFYSQMQMAGHSTFNGNYREMTKIVLVDEADNFLSKDFKSIKKILKEGREFGVGTILSTQFLSHFSTADNEYANYIGTWVVHKVPDMTGKDVKFIFNTQSKAEEDNVINRIKKLEKHHSIVALGNESKPLHIRDKAFWELV